MKEKSIIGSSVTKTNSFLQRLKKAWLVFGIIIVTGVAIRTHVNSINLQNELNNKNKIIEKLNNDDKQNQILMKSQNNQLSDLSKKISDKDRQINSQQSEIVDLKKKLANKNSVPKGAGFSRGGSVNYAGNFKISFYTPYNGSSTGRTATGTRAVPGLTVAVDPRIIPLGSRVYIEGIGEGIAQDTGGAIYGNRIDYCVASEGEAYSKGIRNAKVWIVK